MTIAIFSPAKINLALHVLGQQPNGYHTLQSFSVFATIGDVLHITPHATCDGITQYGAFADQLPSDWQHNLLYKTLVAARSHTKIPPMQIKLHKQLPVAAGIGGGSGNAAALLRYLQGQYALKAEHAHTIAQRMGADVPMCLASRSAWATGLGEQLTFIDAMPPHLGIVLVRPPVGLSTPQVFAALQHIQNAPTPMPVQLPTIDQLQEFLRHTRNDLTPAACALVPQLTPLLACLSTQNVLHSGLSGSGATCFALCPNITHAHELALKLQHTFTDYWIKSGGLL